MSKYDNAQDLDKVYEETTASIRAPADAPNQVVNSFKPTKYENQEPLADVDEHGPTSVALEDAEIAAILRLLNRRHASNILSARNFNEATLSALQKDVPDVVKSDTQPGLPDNFFIKAGAAFSPDLVKLIASLKPHLPKGERLGAGCFGSSYLVTLTGKEPARIVLKRLQGVSTVGTKAILEVLTEGKLDADSRRKIDENVAEARKEHPEFHFTVDPLRLPTYLRWIYDVVGCEGHSAYVMLAADPNPKPWAWVLQWFRFAILGALHGDLKPDNLAGGAPVPWKDEASEKGLKAFAAGNYDRKLLASKNLIDLDNIMIFLIGLREGGRPLGHKRWYPRCEVHLEAELNVLFELTGIKHDFLVFPSTHNKLFVCARPYMSPTDVAHKLGLDGNVQRVEVSPLAEVLGKDAIICQIICKNDHKWPMDKDPIEASNEFAKKIGLPESHRVYSA